MTCSCHCHQNLPATTSPSKTPAPVGAQNTRWPSSANGVPAYPGKPTEKGDWQVTHTAADGRTVIESGMTREYAEQLALWWRWRNDGMENITVTTGPMPDRLENFRTPTGDLHFGQSDEDPNGVRGCRYCNGTAALNGAICPSCRARGDIRKADHDQRRPQFAMNGHAPRPLDLGAHTNGGNIMANNGSIPADTGAGVADNTTTPELRRLCQTNATQWAQLQDNVATCTEWCQMSVANYEGIVGNLTADRHDPATIAEQTAIMDAVRQAGEDMKRASASVENAAAAFMKGAQGLERARAAEDAHAAFAGGPAKNFDAYRAS